MFTAASPLLWFLVITTAVAAGEVLLHESSLPRAGQAVAPGGGAGSLDMSVLAVAYTSSVVPDSHAHVNGHIVKVTNPNGRFSIVEPLPGGCGTITMVSKTADLYSPKCVLAADAGYYNITDYRCIGNLVSDGRVVQTGDFSKRNVNLGIKNGRWVVGYFTPEEIQAGGFEQLIEGLGWIVHEGKNYVEQGWREAYSGAGEGGEGYAKTTSGRTALGFNAKGELLILQFDGHTGAPSWGATLDELADKMIEFGAVEAINLDGGGSTTMIHDGVEIGYSSDRTTWGALVGKYDPHCPIGIGKGNLSRYECMRQVSTILCVHERADTTGGLVLHNAVQLTTSFKQFLPYLTIAAVAAVLLAQARGAGTEQQARIVILTTAFISAQQFVIVILDAHRLCAAAQASPTFSGFYIGVFHIGAVSAGLFVWRTLVLYPDCWRSWRSSVYLPATAFLALGGLLLAGLERKLAFQAATLSSAESALFQLLLCISQMLSGAFMGMSLQASLVLLVKLFPPVQRPPEMALYGLCGMVGTGTAPFVAAAMHVLSPRDSTQVHEVGIVGPVKVTIAMGVAALVLLAFPDLPKATDHSVKALPRDAEKIEDSVQVDSGSESFSDSETEETSLKRRIILGAFAGTALRGSILSSLEAGTSLILETSFGWDKTCTGLAISATFLASIPVTYFYRWCRESLPTIGWVKLLALVGLLGSIFLFDSASDTAVAIFGGSESMRGIPLLIADVLIFPCIYLADSLQRGIMNQHLMPEGSCLDSNHAGVWQMVAWLMQTIGASAARSSIWAQGQNLYALEQVLSILVFLLISRKAVAASLQRMEE